MDAGRDGLSENEKAEVAGLAAELNAIRSRVEAAVDAKDAALAWKIDSEWWEKYRELVAVKRRIRTRLWGRPF